jgi:hypothetical protein
VCPLCHTSPADTREDVLPQWARKRIRKLGVYKGNQVPSILLPLCRDCNAAFGRRYENAAAPILGPMTDGESRELSPSDQELIGRWIVKTLLLGALAPDVPAAPGQREQIRRLCCEMRDRGTPPHQSFVRLAGFDPGQPIDRRRPPGSPPPWLPPTALTDMESGLSRRGRRFLAFAWVCRGLWSAGWMAVRRAVRDAGQTDMRGFGVPQDHGSSWGAAI